MSERSLRAAILFLIAVTAVCWGGLAQQLNLPDISESVFAVKIVDSSIPKKGEGDGECFWSAANARALLGPPPDRAGDDDFVAIGRDGFIAVQMETPFKDGSGVDLRVYVSPYQEQGYYNASISADAESWTEVAHRVKSDNTKTHYKSIDFSGVSGEFEYVRIDGETGGDCTPFVLAIEALHPCGAAPSTGSQTGGAADSASAFSFSEDFNDEASGWGVWSNRDGGHGYRDGKYAIWANDEFFYFFSWAPTDEKCPTNFRVEATAYKFSGSDDAMYGIIWGVDDSNHYSFLVSADGWYVVMFLRRGEWETDPIPWAQSSVIRQRGARNTLSVTIEDGRAALRVNGTIVTSFRLTLPGPYWVGARGDSYENFPVEVRFTEFKIEGLD